MIPSDRPNEQQFDIEKPRFKPCWKMCKCELEFRAKIASAKERRAENIAVIADTTTMKDLRDDSGDLHPTALQAFRLRPHLLLLLAGIFNKHKEQMPHDIVDLADRISCSLFGISLYHMEEQLHLYEFAALESETVNRSIDQEILVRKNLRDEQQNGFITD